MRDLTGFEHSLTHGDGWASHGYEPWSKANGPHRRRVVSTKKRGYLIVADDATARQTSGKRPEIRSVLPSSCPNLTIHIPIPTIPTYLPLFLCTHIPTSTLSITHPPSIPLLLPTAPILPLRHAAHPTSLADRLPIPNILRRPFAAISCLLLSFSGLGGIGRSFCAAELATGLFVRVAEAEVAFVSTMSSCISD